MEYEDGVAHRRDSSFVKPYHPPTNGKPMADIAPENKEVETRKEENRMLDPPALSGFQRDSNI